MVLKQGLVALTQFRACLRQCAYVSFGTEKKCDSLIKLLCLMELTKTFSKVFMIILALVLKFLKQVLSVPVGIFLEADIKLDGKLISYTNIYIIVISIMF